MDILKLSTDLQSNLIRKLGPQSTLLEMLMIVVERAADVLKASACTVFIIDEGRRTATQRAGTGYQQKFIDQAQCRVVLADQVVENPKNGEKLGLTGWILSTGKPFLAHNPKELTAHTHRSGRYDPTQLPDEKLQLQTFLGVPLRSLRGEVVGLIKAERRANANQSTTSFSVNDQIILETLARVASKCLVYVEMAQLGHVEEAITAWTRDVITEAAATEGELDSFLDIVVNVMASAMNADSCGIYLIDESRKTLSQRAGIGSQAPRYVIRSYPLPTREQVEASRERLGLTTWIAAAGKSFYARNFDELHAHRHHKGEYDPLNFLEGTICGAFLGVPLQVGGTIIGVLKVENTSKRGEDDLRDFSETAQRRFDVLALDIALAIMRLQEQGRNRYQVISDAQPTILAILRGGLDVPTLVERVVTETAKLFNAGACALFLQEGDRLIQPPWAAYGWARRGPEVREYSLVKPEEIKNEPTPEEKVGLTVWIAVKRENFTARSNLELRMHPHHKGTFDNDNFGPGQQCESFIGVPLTVGDKLVGILKVETKMRQMEPEKEPEKREFTYFSEQDELVFDLIANSAAIAIENARLLEAQRLAEQIRSQPQNLLLDLHNFAKNHWHPVNTLNQTANHLQGQRPDIARIIENYAALFQPEFNIHLLNTIVDLITPFGDFLESSRAFGVLYKTFVEALRVESPADISKCCSSLNLLADPQLLSPQFFLVQVAQIQVTMYQQIAASLRGEGIEIVGTSSLHQVKIYLDEAKSKAVSLLQPERDIVCRIIERWQQVISDALEHFRPVSNPYVAGPPIDPKAGTPFFGRQDIFEWVAENLLGATQKNILVLHGQRRMGKTSILLQLERGELGRPLRERQDRPLCPVHIDLQGFNDPGDHLFLSGIAKRISKQINRQAILKEHLIIPSISDFKKAPYTTFDDFMSNVSHLIAPAWLVLMFDEFEVLEKLVADRKVDANIYQQLRHQMQFQPNVTFILAGTHQLEELSDNYKGVVFTVALHKEVSFMDETAARDLIQQPVTGQVTYEDAAIAQLLRATHGHPYLLQSLCQHLIAEMNRRKESNSITANDVNAAIEHFANQRVGHIKYIWDESNRIEQVILSVIANAIEAGQAYVAHTDLLSCLQFSSGEIIDARDRLVRRRLIKEVPVMATTNEVTYQPTMALFCKWVNQNFPLSKILEREK